MQETQQSPVRSASDDSHRLLNDILARPDALAFRWNGHGRRWSREVARRTAAIGCAAIAFGGTPMAFAQPAQSTEMRGSSGAATAAAATANEAAAPGVTAHPVGDGTFLLTIFLKHDESKPLPKINQQLKEQGFYKAFPPPGIEIVSWYVMMGIGQVVTLRVPAERLREVNLAIENTAWGGFRTEFYPTYDYKSVALAMRQKAQSGAGTPP